MNINFPKYPFVWNYDDMYLPLEYSSKEITKDELVEFGDENINFLLEFYPTFKIIKLNQKINKSDATNLNIHTWYLSNLKVFETTDNSLIIETDSVLKYKNDVTAFIFDPNNVFDKSIYKENLNNENKNTKNGKDLNYISVIKDKKNILPSKIPKLYIHTHNIKGIFRFSPKDNSIIKFNNDIINPVFYTIVQGVIVVNQVNLVNL